MWKVDCYIHILKSNWRFWLYFFWIENSTCKILQVFPGTNGIFSTFEIHFRMYLKICFKVLEIYLFFEKFRKFVFLCSTRKESFLFFWSEKRQTEKCFCSEPIFSVKVKKNKPIFLSRLTKKYWCQRTFKTWLAVRKGEEKWFFCSNSTLKIFKHVFLWKPNFQVTCIFFGWRGLLMKTKT